MGGKLIHLSDRCLISYVKYDSSDVSLTSTTFASVTNSLTYIGSCTCIRLLGEVFSLVSNKEIKPTSPAYSNSTSEAGRMGGGQTLKLSVSLTRIS